MFVGLATQYLIDNLPLKGLCIKQWLRPGSVRTLLFAHYYVPFLVDLSTFLESTYFRTMQPWPLCANATHWGRIAPNGGFFLLYLIGVARLILCYCNPVRAISTADLVSSSEISTGTNFSPITFSYNSI